MSSISSPKSEAPPLQLPDSPIPSPKISPSPAQGPPLGLIQTPPVIIQPPLIPRGSYASLNSLATTSNGAPPCEVTITFFLPLMRNLKQKVEKISRRYQQAEHHRRICGTLLDRALIADEAVRYFESKQNSDQEFWTSAHNYQCIKRLAQVIDQIEDFVRNISQLRRYRRFVRKHNIQLTFEQLAFEIDNVLRDFKIVTPNADQFQVGQDIKIVQEDLNDMVQYLQEIRGGITDSTGQVSREIEDMYVLYATYRVRKPLPLSLASSVEVDPSTVERSKSAVQPSMNVEKAIWRNREVALTRIKRQYKDDDVSGKNKIRNNVAILKKIETSLNIILFHGVMEEYDESKRFKHLYIVTEWAEFGNLREYYKKFGPLSWTKKLSLAVDIARGLIYLRAIDVLHYELTPDAILITSEHRAKVSGCGVNHFANDNRQASSERISDMVNKYRYVAPEKLKSDFPYDAKCEIYSFGMLLLEIAEENIPLHGHNYNNVIEALRENTYRQSQLFTRTKMAPKEYRELVFSAISHERNRRPPFSEIFLSLNAMLKRCKAAQDAIESPLSPSCQTGEILIGLSEEIRLGLPKGHFDS